MNASNFTPLVKGARNQSQYLIRNGFHVTLRIVLPIICKQCYQVWNVARPKRGSVTWNRFVWQTLVSTWVESLHTLFPIAAGLLWSQLALLTVKIHP